jgi:protein-tyrosine-phosphatase
MSGILVVCTGNICRSPMAEGFLRAALVRRLGDDAPTVTSAGTAGWDGSRATEEAIRAADELGVDIRGHSARHLDDPILDDADLIVCMAAEHRTAILHGRPDLSSTTFTLSELVGLLEASPASGSIGARVAAATAGRNGSPPSRAGDIRDPLGEPLDGYREVAAELRELSDRLADALVEASA